MSEIAKNMCQDGAVRVPMMTAPQNNAGRQRVRDRLAIYRLGVLALWSGSDVIYCGPDLHELMQPEHFSHSVRRLRPGTGRWPSWWRQRFGRC